MPVSVEKSVPDGIKKCPYLRNECCISFVKGEKDFFDKKNALIFSKITATGYHR